MDLQCGTLAGDRIAIPPKAQAERHSGTRIGPWTRNEHSRTARGSEPNPAKFRGGETARGEGEGAEADAAAGEQLVSICISCLVALRHGGGEAEPKRVVSVS